MAIGEQKNPEKDDELEALLTTKEVADLLKVSERHVQNMGRRGTFPKPIKLGRRVLFRPQDIRRFLNGDADDGGLMMNQAI